MKVKIKRVEDLVFTGMGDTGHYVMMDTVKRFGGTEGASQPKELLLMALAGCTGMDVASILRKMHVPMDRFEVWIDAEVADEHPMVFTNILVQYRFFGNHIDTTKVEQAIELSETKYCAVTAMLRGTVNIQSAYVVNPNE